MTTNDIWILIEESKSYDGNQIDYLIKTLSKKSVTEIIDFSIHFETCYRLSYTSDMWGAAYLIMNGCSKDCFDNFRSWLIAQGEHTFTNTLANPEYLATYIPKACTNKGISLTLESMITLASTAYTFKHTNSTKYNDDYYNNYLDLMKSAGFNFIYPIIIFDWDDDHDLKQKFPLLWAKFYNK